MKFFQFSLKKLEFMGLTAAQNLYNEKVLMAFLILFIENTTVLVFLFHEADDFIEYANSIYAITATNLITVCYIIIITLIDDIFELIDNLEYTIDNSMCIKIPIKFDKLVKSIWICRIEICSIQSSLWKCQSASRTMEFNYIHGCCRSYANLCFFTEIRC